MRVWFCVCEFMGLGFAEICFEWLLRRKARWVISSVREWVSGCLGGARGGLGGGGMCMCNSVTANQSIFYIW